MDVFCFDFDGVVCDSAPETALSAWKGCREFWPAGGAPFSEALQQRFCRVRPALHTGFEAIPLMRLIETDAASEAEVLAGFPALRDDLIAREGLDNARLLEVFGRIRDGLIAADQAEWLRWNRFYPGLRETLTAALERHPVFIITTKQERFVTLLLAHHGVDFPSERILGLERGRSKPALLGELGAAPAWQGHRFHFIEDRLETLQEVLATPSLAAVQLYLADWGYNTDAQRAEAAATGRIAVVSRDDFRRRHGF